MAKRTKSNSGVAVFLNGHLLTPHTGNKIEEKDHEELQEYLLNGRGGYPVCVHFSFTNTYVLKLGTDDGGIIGRVVGISFTEPVSYGDTISLLDSGKWGVNIVHYQVGVADCATGMRTREITLDE